MIILFDVDGVLVENRAYRAGIQRTTEYFAQRLGLAAAPPSDADIDVFEAESITVEWDFVCHRRGGAAHAAAARRGAHRRRP